MTTCLTAPLSDCDLGQFHNVTIVRLLNGEVKGIFTKAFLNARHADRVLSKWNAIGEMMSRHENPVDGIRYHWSYRKVPS